MLLVAGARAVPIFDDRPVDPEDRIGSRGGREIGGKLSEANEGRQIMRVDARDDLRIGHVVQSEPTRDTGLESAFHRVAGEVVSTRRAAGVKEDSGFRQPKQCDRPVFVPMHALGRAVYSQQSPAGLAKPPPVASRRLVSKAQQPTHRMDASTTHGPPAGRSVAVAVVRQQLLEGQADWPMPARSFLMASNAARRAANSSGLGGSEARRRRSLNTAASPSVRTPAISSEIRLGG